jgi:hypothetical protein
MSYKMKGCAYSKSPLKQDIDTTFAERVYTEHKVDEDLKKKGYHTGKKPDGTYDRSLRGKKDTDPGSKNVGGNNRILGAKEMYN